MTKTDLRARLIFHRTRDAIETYLTMVIPALAFARLMPNATGLSLKKFTTSLRLLREITGCIGSQDITFDPEATGQAEELQ